MISENFSAEDAIPQAWDLVYSVSSGRLTGTRAWNYVSSLAEIFKSGFYYDGISLAEFASLSHDSLPASERLPKNELLTLLRRGIALDMPESDGNYGGSFYGFQGTIFRLHGNGKIKPQKSLVFSIRESELGRAVSELVPESRISEKGLEWLLEVSEAGEDSAKASCRFLEDLGADRNAIGSNIELLGIAPEKLGERLTYLEDRVNLERQQILQTPRLLLRSPGQIDDSIRALETFGLSAEQMLQFCGLLAISEERLRERRGLLSERNLKAGSDPAMLGMHPGVLAERIEYLTMRAGMDANAIWPNYELLRLNAKTMRDKTKLIHSDLRFYGFQPDKIASFARENPRLWLEPLSELERMKNAGGLMNLEKSYQMGNEIDPDKYARILGMDPARFRRNYSNLLNVGLSQDEFARSPELARLHPIHINKTHGFLDDLFRDSDGVDLKKVLSRFPGVLSARASRLQGDFKFLLEKLSIDDCVDWWLDQSSDDDRGLEQLDAMITAVAGRRIQEELPEIADDLRNGMKYQHIILKHNIQRRQGIRNKTLTRKALSCAVNGYGSSRVSYGPLIPSRGRVAWSEEEKEDLHKMLQSAYFRKGSRADNVKLAAYANRKYHGGEPIITTAALNQSLRRYREELEKTGKKTELNKETKTLLDCLLIAERNEISIEELATRFNSASKTSLTPEELEKKIQKELAVDSYDQLLSESRRENRKHNKWSYKASKDVHEKSLHPYFRKGSKANKVKLADYANRKYHGGEPVITTAALKHRLKRYREELEKTGKKTELNKETKTLLDCLLIAEREKSDIKELTTQFNSASKTSLTTEELEKKIQKELAVDSYDQLLSESRRENRKHNKWSYKASKDLHEKSLHPYFRKGSQTSIIKLTDYANRKYHDGKPAITKNALDKHLREHRKKLEKTGKKTELNKETKTLLDCLLIAEREKSDIKELTTQFNSASKTSLTTEELEKKIQKELAVDSYDQLLSESRRENNKYSEPHYEEVKDLHEKSLHHYFRKGSRVDSVKLADYANRKYHDGKPVRTKETLCNRLSRHRKKLKETGEKTELSKETETLLDCLLIAEREKSDIKELTTQFNSASKTSLTTEELEKKIQKELAVDSYDQLLSESRRENSRQGGLPYEEVKDVHEKSLYSYFRRGRRADNVKLADYANRKYHDGRPVITKEMLNKRLSRHRKELEKTGEKAELSEETETLLDCLLIAEREKSSIEELTTQFNSASKTSLTPEELDGRLEETLAIRYEKLISA